MTFYVYGVSMKKTNNYDYWFSLYQAHIESGQAISTFCHSRGIKPDTFRSAVKRHKFSSPNESALQPSSKFLELTNISSSNEPYARVAIEVQFKDVTLRVFEVQHAQALAHTLHHLMTLESEAG